jgi:hypothetical protein
MPPWPPVAAGTARGGEGVDVGVSRAGAAFGAGSKGTTAPRIPSCPLAAPERDEEGVGTALGCAPQTSAITAAPVFARRNASSCAVVQDCACACDPAELPTTAMQKSDERKVRDVFIEVTL